jgi:hypothetical protein
MWQDAFGIVKSLRRLVVANGVSRLSSWCLCSASMASVLLKQFIYLALLFRRKATSVTRD